MLMGTIFGVILIPGLYVIFAGLAARKHKTPEEPLTEMHHEMEIVN
jgi:hypothetical protein